MQGHPPSARKTVKECVSWTSQNTLCCSGSGSIAKFCSTLATPWTTACYAPLSFTISRNLLKFMSVELVMPPNHLILCRSLLLLLSVFPSIRVFPNEPALCIRWPQYRSFSFQRLPMTTGHLITPHPHPNAARINAGILSKTSHLLLQISVCSFIVT